MSTQEKIICIWNLRRQGVGGCVNKKEKVLQQLYCQQKKRATNWKNRQTVICWRLRHHFMGYLIFWVALCEPNAIKNIRWWDRKYAWCIGGMILTGENWSTGRKTLYSMGGRWMNEYGAMVEWYWQGKTEVLREKRYIAWVVDVWMSVEDWWNFTNCWN